MVKTAAQMQVEQAIQECADVLSMARKLLAASGVDVTDRKLIAVQNLITEADGDVWRLTFKSRRLLPTDPSATLIGLGGELFVTIDRTDRAIRSVTHGE